MTSNVPEQLPRKMNCKRTSTETHLPAGFVILGLLLVLVGLVFVIWGVYLVTTVLIDLYVDPATLKHNGYLSVSKDSLRRATVTENSTDLEALIQLILSTRSHTVIIACPTENAPNENTQILGLSLAKAKQTADANKRHGANVWLKHSLLSNDTFYGGDPCLESARVANEMYHGTIYGLVLQDTSILDLVHKISSSGNAFDETRVQELWKMYGSMVSTWQTSGLSTGLAITDSSYCSKLGNQIPSNLFKSFDLIFFPGVPNCGVTQSGTRVCNVPTKYMLCMKFMKMKAR